VPDDGQWSKPMQAITTKYIGPSNVRGSRVKAQCQAGSITLEWDDSLNSERNHETAAKALAAKLDWRGKWRGGSPHDGHGFCFVCLEDPAPTGFVVYEQRKPVPVIPLDWTDAAKLI
jgi:hypothetical protein